jgi:hypothetical protein
MLVGNLRQRNKMINNTLHTSLLVICILFFASAAAGQSKVLSSRGFLILSDGYKRYLDSLKTTDVINFPFIPVELSTLDSLTRYSERHINSLTNQRCYRDSLFHIVAVEIKYVYLNRTKHPLVCDDPIQLGFDDRMVIFSFANPEVRIISLRKL